MSRSQDKVALFIETKLFSYGIVFLILTNAVILGLETDKEIYGAYGTILRSIDTILLSMFTIEIALKLFVYRTKFFQSGWNIFDFSIVAIAWFPASGALSVLRAFRILRVLRLISVLPQMRRVISALGHSIPGMMSVLGILILIFYIGAVLATKLFGAHPDQYMQEWFGSISASAYTLFQIMTLESWSMGIVRPTMEIFPISWVFFIPFIIITSFVTLNFFIGIVVDSMQTVQNLDAKKHATDDSAPITQKEFRELKSLLEEIKSEKKSP